MSYEHRLAPGVHWGIQGKPEDKEFVDSIRKTNDGVRIRWDRPEFKQEQFGVNWLPVRDKKKGDKINVFRMCRKFKDSEEFYRYMMRIPEKERCFNFMYPEKNTDQKLKMDLDVESKNFKGFETKELRKKIYDYVIDVVGGLVAKYFKEPYEKNSELTQTYPFVNHEWPSETVILSENCRKDKISYHIMFLGLGFPDLSHKVEFIKRVKLQAEAVFNDDEELRPLGLDIDLSPYNGTLRLPGSRSIKWPQNDPQPIETFLLPVPGQNCYFGDLEDCFVDNNGHFSKLIANDFTGMEDKTHFLTKEGLKVLIKSIPLPPDFGKNKQQKQPVKPTATAKRKRTEEKKDTDGDIQMEDAESKTVVVVEENQDAKRKELDEQLTLLAKTKFKDMTGLKYTLKESRHSWRVDGGFKWTCGAGFFHDSGRQPKIMLRKHRGNKIKLNVECWSTQCSNHVEKTDIELIPKELAQFAEKTFFKPNTTNHNKKQKPNGENKEEEVVTNDDPVWQTWYDQLSVKHETELDHAKALQSCPQPFFYITTNHKAHAYLDIKHNVFKVIDSSHKEIAVSHFTKAFSDILELHFPGSNNVRKLYCDEQKEANGGTKKVKNENHVTTFWKSITSAFADDTIFTKFDREFTHLLPQQNKTAIDLKTGKIVPLLPSHMFSRFAPIEWPGFGNAELTAKVEQYQQQETILTPEEEQKFFPSIMDFIRPIFLNENVTEATQADQRTIQETLGHFLCGDIYLHYFFVIYSTGRSGKSSILRLLIAVMGPFQSVAAKSIFTQESKANGVTHELNEVCNGVRFAHISEAGAENDETTAKRSRIYTLNTGEKFLAQEMKRLTGGDPIPLRELYTRQKSITQHNAKFCTFTNHLMNLHNNDQNDFAIDERMRIHHLRAQFRKAKDFDEINKKLEIQKQEEAKLRGIVVEPNDDIGVTKKAKKDIEAEIVKDHLNDWISWLVIGSIQKYHNNDIFLSSTYANEATVYSNQHNFETWVRKRVKHDTNATKIERSTIYALYEKYCEENEVDKMIKEVFMAIFKKAFQNNGYVKKNQGKWYFKEHKIETQNIN